MIKKADVLVPRMVVFDSWMKLSVGESSQTFPDPMLTVTFSPIPRSRLESSLIDGSLAAGLQIRYSVISICSQRGLEAVEPVMLVAVSIDQSSWQCNTPIRSSESCSGR